MATFTAYIEFDEESKLYLGVVPGAHTQAASLDELNRNLREVLELCLEENAELRDHLSRHASCRATSSSTGSPTRR